MKTLLLFFGLFLITTFGYSQYCKVCGENRFFISDDNSSIGVSFLNEKGDVISKSNVYDGYSSISFNENGDIYLNELLIRTYNIDSFYIAMNKCYEFIKYCVMNDLQPNNIIVSRYKTLLFIIDDRLNIKIHDIYNQLSKKNDYNYLINNNNIFGENINTLVEYPYLDSFYGSYNPEIIENNRIKCLNVLKEYNKKKYINNDKVNDFFK